jgi:hypothetical protein
VPGRAIFCFSAPAASIADAAWARVVALADPAHDGPLAAFAWTLPRTVCGKVDGKFLRASSPDCLRWELDLQPVLPLGRPDEFDSNATGVPALLQVGHAVDG